MSYIPAPPPLPVPKPPTLTDETAQIYKPFPSATLLKGALVASPRSTDDDPLVEVPFQYNPKKLTRTLTPQYYGDRAERFDAPPTESIGLKVELESSAGPAWRRKLGVGPYLAALQLMIYPTSSELETWSTNAASDRTYVVPPLAPRCLFIWGPGRVLPVQLTKMTVNETFFDDRLTPVMAEVDLDMTLYPLKKAEEKDFQLLLTNVKKLETLRSQLNVKDTNIGVTSVGSL